jgi:hypothetical protein
VDKFGFGWPCFHRESNLRAPAKFQTSGLCHFLLGPLSFLDGRPAGCTCTPSNAPAPNLYVVSGCYLTRANVGKPIAHTSCEKLSKQILIIVVRKKIINVLAKTFTSKLFDFLNNTYRKIFKKIQKKMLRIK